MAFAWDRREMTIGVPNQPAPFLSGKPFNRCTHTALSPKGEIYVSVVKRRHDLTRCRYRGEAGMQRWVGLGVIADNLVNIGRAIQQQDRR